MVDREWMYNRVDEDGYLRNEFVVGVDTFINFACDHENFRQYPFLKCPCSNCWNKPHMEVDSVKLHLYKNGYRDNYSCWSCHGETYVEAQPSSEVRSQLNPYRDMVIDSYVPRSEVSSDEGLEDGEEPPNQQARQFFDMLKNAEKPLYDGCKKTLLSMASRMINLKCEFNIPHRAIDGFASFMKDICPNDNLMTESFYATRKLVQGLELPHLKIDVCRKGCVLFLNENAHHKPHVAKGVSCSVNVGHASISGEIKYLDDKDYQVAHGYVLANCELLKDYERVFETELKRLHPRVRPNEIWNKFADQFPEWLKKYVTKSEHIKTDLIKTLAIGPYKSVRKYDHYYINGYNFHTYSYGKNKATMNYGVCVKSLQGSNYYGILQEVFELVYGGETRSYKTILFKCDWFDSGNGTIVHPQYKLVEVNHTKKYFKYDPFVLAYQVQQVYYMPYPSLNKDKDYWWAVFPVKVRTTIDIPKVQIAFQEEVIDNPPLLSNPNDGMDGVWETDGFEEAVLLDENDDDDQIEVETDEEEELLTDDETSSDEAESDDAFNA